MKSKIANILLINSVLLLNLSACQYSKPISQPHNEPVIKTYQQKFSLKSQLLLAQKKAQEWSTQATLTGAYDIVFDHSRFLSFEFISPQYPNQQLSLKITDDLSITKKITQTPLLNQAFPTPRWKTSASKALRLAKNAGFNATNNFGIGLSFWGGMGIQKKSLKWSVLSFEHSDIAKFYVIDDKTQKVWTCQNANATSGCLPIQQIKNRLQSVL